MLKNTIEREGFTVVNAATANELDRAISGDRVFHLLIMDRMMGSEDLKSRIPAIRKRWPKILILAISAIDTPLERASLIDEGVDDYLGKPFFTEEFLARIRALLRRAPGQPEQRAIGEAILDLTERRIFVEQKFEELPHREFMILNVLSEKNKVFSRPELLEIVWGNANHSETNLVEATVTNLRRRIATLNCGFRIRNRRNVGYWIES